MKDFVFVSDFDGTLTDTDFYHIVIDQCLGERGRDLYASWKRQEMKDVEFLSNVFQNINRDEDGVAQLINCIQFDTAAAPMMQRIRAVGGEIVILSAGADYYIRSVLQKLGLPDIPIFANPSEFRDRGICMVPDPASPYYSDFYGIDKRTVVNKLRNKYKKIYYAGDSTPDVEAALLADTVYAKGTLIRLLQERGCNCIPVLDFKEIEQHLVKTGVLNDSREE